MDEYNIILILMSIIVLGAIILYKCCIKINKLANILTELKISNNDILIASNEIKVKLSNLQATLPK